MSSLHSCVLLLVCSICPVFLLYGFFLSYCLHLCLYLTDQFLLYCLSILFDGYGEGDCKRKKIK